MSWLKKYKLPEYQIIGTVPFAPMAAPTQNNQVFSLASPEPTIHLKLNDPRKIRMTTGQKINPNVDLVSGEYVLNDIDTVIKNAKAMGLSVEDAYNLAAMDLQETGWGNKDGEIGHALIGKGNTPEERFLNAYSEKMKEADRLKIKDPMLRLQVYNGMGVVTPKTEKDYHGFEMQKIYGVPIPKEGISMRKNPLYGKQIIDLRDNVLKKNPDFVNYINSIYPTPSKKDGGWLDEYAQGGQPPVNPNGMYDGVRDWRIPGGNITMQGVPFPVLAKASNGMSAIMQPGGEYNFPGAKHVDEYPMMQNGGWLEKYQSKGQVTLPPIYTDDPADVRRYLRQLQANTDSLHKYNQGEKEYLDLLNLQKKHGVTKGFPATFRIKPFTEESVGLKNFEDIFGGNLPIERIGFNIGQFDDANFKMKDIPEARRYRKPQDPKNIQPYILKSKPQPKPEPTLKRNPVSMPSISYDMPEYNPQIRELGLKGVESQMTPLGKYKTSYYDPQMKDWNERAFMSQQESDQFADEMSKRGYPGSYGNVTQRMQYKFGGSELKNGGWLEKYQEKGLVIPGVTDFKMPKPLSESSSLGIQNNRIVSNQKLPVKETVNENPEYIVKSGDTLSKIANAYNTTPMKLAQYNNIANPNVIGVNQKIKIPVAKQIPQEYQDWETIKQRNQQIDLLPDEQKIISYYNNRPDDSYLVVDKKNAKMNLYKGNKLVKSYEVGVGANPGDAQTVTRVVNGKTDWTGGNKSTGAGVYTISRVDPKSHEYFDLPAFNLKNDQGLEVATTIHGTPLARRAKFDNNNILDNRMSNGCINGKCFDLQDMYGKVDVGSKVYILPEDQGNQFQIIDGKPVLKVNAKNRVKYNEYTDQTGQKRKGQGANQSINTLQYKPITSTLDEKAFKNDVYQANDFNDDNEYTYTTKPYVNALVNNKQKIMQATHIPSDVYNEIAKMSFGIYGTESNFGDTHSALGNFGRAIGKWWNPKGSSSPDYKSKATTYGADEESNSVGLTQMRWSYLNKDEKDALTKLGITSNKDLLNAEKAAIATTAVLAIRYNQQLTDDQKKDIWTNLPTKWNTRANYGSRVKNNSKYLTFKQLDEVRKKDGGWLNTYK
jgi:LysM repeat protein